MVFYILNNIHLEKQHINYDIELIIIREMCHMDNITTL